MHALKNPCQDPKIRELLSRTRKAYAKRGALPQKKAALTKEPLQALLDTCDASLRGTRDRALLLFAWSSGGRRRSEVAGADMQFLKRVEPDGYIYDLAFSKTNQSGVDQPENHKPVAGIAGMKRLPSGCRSARSLQGQFLEESARAAILARRSPLPLSEIL
jgi:hypothetical protein